MSEIYKASDLADTAQEQNLEQVPVGTDTIVLVGVAEFGYVAHRPPFSCLFFMLAVTKNEAQEFLRDYYRRIA